MMGSDHSQGLLGAFAGGKRTGDLNGEAPETLDLYAPRFVSLLAHHGWNCTSLQYFQLHFGGWF